MSAVAPVSRVSPVSPMTCMHQKMQTDESGQQDRAAPLAAKNVRPVFRNQVEGCYRKRAKQRQVKQAPKSASSAFVLMAHVFHP